MIQSGLGVLLILGGLGVGMVSASLVLAQTGTTGSLYSVAFDTTNATASAKNDLQVPFVISTASLIDDSFITSDALNTVVQRGGTDMPAMPGTNRIVVKGAAQDDGGAFTDYTAAAQGTAASDVQLLPSSPAVDDAFYFGLDVPAGMGTVDIDQAGVGTWTLTWEYYNGASWTALSNVDDRTSGFTVLGRNVVTWTIPSDWSTSTVVTISAYWVRARVSAFTSAATQPLASQAHWETGQWWSWVESLPVNTQEQYTLFLGGADMLTYHQLFTGSAGITTDDAAGLEPGGTFVVALNARPHFSTLGSSSCLACKSGVISLYPSDSNVFTATVTGSSTTTLVSPSMSLGDTGSHNIILASDGSNLGLFVDGDAGLVVGDAQAVTDNANAWSWSSADALDYTDQVAFDAGTGDVLSLLRSYAEWAGGTLSGTAAYTGKLGLANE